jgi:hypothetical protein
MRVRPYEERDREELEKIHAESGFEFKFPDLSSSRIELAIVVADDLEDKPIAVCVAKRSPEIIMALGKKYHPSVKLHALRLIHDEMNDRLMALGYTEANCFLPPQLEKGYGRHLRRIFGWLPAWKGYTIVGKKRVAIRPKA